jgi:outer membrane protein OmpA-like peptidoglycan-associated protein
MINRWSALAAAVIAQLLAASTVSADECQVWHSHTRNGASVFFVRNGDQPTAMATRSIDAAARDFRSLSTDSDVRRVAVVGHAYREGSLERMIRLSRQRAESVVASLIEAGVPIRFNPHPPAMVPVFLGDCTEAFKEKTWRAYGWKRAPEGDRR